MTVELVRKGIMDKAVTVQGIEPPADEDRYPASLAAADLPVPIAWPEEAENKQQSHASNMSLRTWRLAVYVMSAEHGEGIDEGWQLATDLLHRFIDTFLDTDNRQVLNDGTYIADIQASNEFPMTDTGLTQLAYPPPATGSDGYPHYFGFELRFTVKEYWVQT